MTPTKAKSFSGAEYSITLATLPDECPRCHHNVQPLLRHAQLITVLPTKGPVLVHAVFQCPRQSCTELFLARYLNENRRQAKITHLDSLAHPVSLKSLEPRSPKLHAFPEEIVEVSPRFVEAFNQASAAETFALGEIAGPGYGKALELLIKDYLIHHSPAEAASIKREFLANVIRNRVTDSRLKQCAERATWLRNDETHYERKWSDKDRSDLKNLITLTVNWVNSTLFNRRFRKGYAGGEKMTHSGLTIRWSRRGGRPPYHGPELRPGRPAAQLRRQTDNE